MTDRSKQTLDRRAFVTRSAGTVGGIVAAAALPWETHAADAQTRQATGLKIGEVTDRSALVWTRLTAAAWRNTTGPRVEGRLPKGQKPVSPEHPDRIFGACPGAPGRVRVRWSKRENLSGAQSTEWAGVGADTDFSHPFPLAGLEPATVYHIAVETASADGREVHAPLHGRFQTAPAAGDAADITFCVNTCLMWAERDKGDDDGFNIFPAMSKLDPKFICFTGDNVYYDGEEPLAFNEALARFHWERMYSLPRHVEAIRTCATYWQKDDHDTLANDSWPGGKPYGQLTFAQGQAIFRQQVPLGPLPYRTYRWGKHLQVWLTDGRDYRSPNNIPDGPQKTIWGAEQRAWLQKTMLESDATWKILVTPTPIVGPDRPNKNDNHSNARYSYEGGGFRAFVQQHMPRNFFALCGDRHWQYHSVHPESGVHEFAVGPGTDNHAAGTPGHDPAYHRFHRVKGGFLSVTVKSGAIALRHHDVNGKVVYEYKPG